MAVLAWRRTGMPRLAGQGREYSLLTALNVLLFFGLQTVAIGLLPSGLAAVLVYLQPVLVGLLAWWLLGEPMTAPKILGLVVGFAGIVVVSGGAFVGHVSAAGVGLAVASALAWALGTIVFKGTDGRVDPWWAVALPFLVGGALLTVVGLVVEGPDISLVAAVRRRAGVRRARGHGSRLVALVRPGRRRRGRPRGVVHLLRAAGRRRGRSGPAGRDPDRLAAGRGGPGRARCLPGQPAPSGPCFSDVGDSVSRVDVRTGGAGGPAETS